MKTKTMIGLSQWDLKKAAADYINKNLEAHDLEEPVTASEVRLFSGFLPDKSEKIITAQVLQGRTEDPIRRQHRGKT